MWDAGLFRAAIRTWAAGGPGAAAAAAVARDLAGEGLTTVVLVEGVSDLSAVEALAARYGRDLAGEGVCVVPIGGAMGVGRFLRIFGRDGLAVDVRGLCDEAEEGYFRRGLEQAGYGGGLTRSTMEARGFYVCVADLEDELIRAMGLAGVEQVLAAEHDLARFRTFQNQPAQRGRAVERQLRRFLGTTSGRKALYARALIAALDLGRVPRPLDRLLTGSGGGAMRPIDRIILPEPTRISTLAQRHTLAGDACGPERLGASHVERQCRRTAETNTVTRTETQMGSPQSTRARSAWKCAT